MLNISSTVSPVAATTYTSPLASTSTSTSTDATTATADSSQLSTMGQLMSQLQDLASTDPDKAKTVLAKIGSDLKSQADTSGDAKLGALADKFTQASQTGDVSSLQPKGSGHHHHHHGGGGGAATPSQQVDQYQQSGSDHLAESAPEIESAIQGALSS